MLVFLSFAPLTAVYAAQGVQPGPQSLSLTISASESVAKAGSPVKLTIIATNASDHDVVYYDGPSGLYRIYVRDATGGIAPETPEGVRKHPWSPHRTGGGGVISGPSFREHLGAGEKQETDIDLTKEYNLSQPGKYTVQVERPDPENKGKWLKSNTITVTVTP
jgi:hypothetical protein